MRHLMRFVKGLAVLLAMLIVLVVAIAANWLFTTQSNEVIALVCAPIAVAVLYGIGWTMD